MRAYYYTPLVFGLSALAMQRVKICLATEANDPFELRGVNLSAPDFRDAYEKMIGEQVGKYGMICFSRSWQIPTMWSHYADRHRGLCLGFDIPDSHAWEIEYSAHRREVLDVRAAGAENQLKAILGTKSDTWAYEREVRLMSTLDPDTFEDGLYFHDFGENLTLRDVFLGVRCAAPAANISRLVGDAVAVRRTRLAYQSFDIIGEEDVG